MNVITAENISKVYTLGGVRHYSLRESLTGLFSSARRTEQVERISALDGVSFTIDNGETVGFIGHNGAGKSTLLKILSRITKPTSGTADIHGRVGSLLEVGTGFHAELSGRENIYLNGAILGMRRAEIDQKFDEIVAFSEIERFLDTPVKFYSSGMYMRLAFSVAAHLDPEVLIVDEVLAVGDVGFQKKCLRKMRDIGESGRTVIFVSHDMQAVSRLCSRAIWLNEGVLRADGPTNDVVSAYLHEQTRSGAEKVWADASTAPGNDVARLSSVRVEGIGGESISTFDVADTFAIAMTYEVFEAGSVSVPSIQLHNDQGVCIFASHDWYSGWRERPRDKGIYTSRASIPANLLAEGIVFVSVGLTTHQPYIPHFNERDVVTFRIVDAIDGDSARGDLAGNLPGVVRPVLEWKTDVTDAK